MPSRESDAMIPRGVTLSMSAVAGLLLCACGSDNGHPAGVVSDTVMPEASTSVQDANAVMDVTRSDTGLYTMAALMPATLALQDATDSSADEAEAAEPPLCMGEGGPVHLDQQTAPAQATGVCTATIHRAATTSVSAGVTIRLVGLTPDARTMAWFETGTLNYADRDSATAAWNPAHSVDQSHRGARSPSSQP